jgi:O-antigen ligase
MRGKNPRIEPPNPALVIKRNLALAEWILLITGALIFSAGMLFLGPVKLALALIFIVIVTLTFFSPRYGLYTLYFAEGMYVLVFYINMMALAPQQLGLDYTISYYIEGAELFIAPLMVLYVAFLMGFLARTWISKETFIFTPLERIVTLFLVFCVLWVVIAVVNEHYPLIILTDMHVVLLYMFAIFAARSFNKIEDFRSLFNFFIIISFLHWIFLTAYFFQQRLYTEVMFIMDSVRSIQGSSDLYSPYIPLMLAMISINYPGKKSGLEKYYPLIIFLFSARTILCLSRGAMIQVIVGLIVLYLILPVESRKKFIWHVKRQFLYGFIFVLFLFAVAPSRASLAFKLIIWRTTTGGDTGGMSQGSLKYRALETQIVWENIVESPIIGYGPGKQTYKRMFVYTSAAQEPYVHNGFLWIILKFGFIGLMVYLFVMGRYFVSVRNMIRGSPPLSKAILLGTVASMAGIMVIVIPNNVIAAVQGIQFISFAMGIVIFLERQSLIKQETVENVQA